MLEQAKSSKYKIKKIITPEDEFVQYRNEVKECCVVIDIDRFIHLIPHYDNLALHHAVVSIIREGAARWVCTAVYGVT